MFEFFVEGLQRLWFCATKRLRHTHNSNDNNVITGVYCNHVGKNRFKENYELQGHELTKVQSVKVLLHFLSLLITFLFYTLAIIKVSKYCILQLEFQLLLVQPFEMI